MTKYSSSINLRADTQPSPAWFGVAILRETWDIGKLRLLGERGIWELSYWWNGPDQRGDISVSLPGQSGDSAYSPSKARLVVMNNNDDPRAEIQLLFPAGSGWMNAGELGIDASGYVELCEDPGPSTEVASVLKEVTL